jgi:hypothetical protein
LQVREDMVDVDVCAAARSLLERAMMLHRLKRDVKTSMLSMSQLLATLSQR